MSYALGIDVGTASTAAAVLRTPKGSGHPEPEALVLGTHSPSIPSVIHVGEDGQVLIGEEAERRAADSPGRVIREFTRRVGDSVPIVVGDVLISAEHVYARLVRWVVDQAAEHEAAAPDAICLTHPAAWGRHRITLVREALAGVGLGDVELVSEPCAAATHHSAKERLDIGSTVAIYDLGGSTFDVAVLQKDAAGEFAMQGRPGGLERLGGGDFDDAIFRHVLAGLADRLTGLDLSDPDSVVALSRLRAECTAAKEALSFDGETSVPVVLPGLLTRIRLVRSELEDLIGHSIRQSVATLREALESAGLEPAALTCVILVGGTSRIPLVSELLSEELRRPIVVEVDPKASISLGAATVAAARARTTVVAGDVAAPADVAADLPAPPLEAVTPIVSGAPGRSGQPAESAGFRLLRPPVQAIRATSSVLSRTGVRLAVVAAAAAAVVVLAGTAPHTSGESGSPIDAAAAADFTPWHRPTTPSSATQMLFAAPGAAPSGDGATGEGDAPSDDPPSPTRPHALPPGVPAGGGPGPSARQDPVASPTPYQNGTTTPPGSTTPAPGASTPTPDTQAPAITETLAPDPDPVPESTPDPEPSPTPDPQPEPEPEPQPEPEPTDPLTEDPPSSSTLAPDPLSSSGRG